MKTISLQECDPDKYLTGSDFEIMFGQTEADGNTRKKRQAGQELPDGVVFRSFQKTLFVQPPPRFDQTQPPEGIPVLNFPVYILNNVLHSHSQSVGGSEGSNLSSGVCGQEPKERLF